MQFDPQLPSPFYRVTSRAIILDDQNRLIVVQDDKGKWQIPGGGWEHGETFLECIQHELQEELGAVAVSVAPDVFMYSVLDHKGYYSLRIAAKVTLESFEFMPGDDMVAYRAVSRQEFLAMEFTAGEGPVQDYADQIWS